MSDIVFTGAEVDAASLLNEWLASGESLEDLSKRIDRHAAQARLEERAAIVGWLREQASAVGDQRLAELEASDFVGDHTIAKAARSSNRTLNIAADMLEVRNLSTRGDQK